MKKIQSNDELEIGEWYWLINKIFPELKPVPTIKQVVVKHHYEEGLEEAPKQFEGGTWCHNKNSQALKNYDIYGPIPLPKFLQPDTIFRTFEEILEKLDRPVLFEIEGDEHISDMFDRYNEEAIIAQFLYAVENEFKIDIYSNIDYSNTFLELKEFIEGESTWITTNHF